MNDSPTVSRPTHILYINETTELSLFAIHGVTLNDADDTLYNNELLTLQVEASHGFVSLDGSPPLDRSRWSGDTLSEELNHQPWTYLKGVSGRRDQRVVQVRGFLRDLNYLIDVVTYRSEIGFSGRDTVVITGKYSSERAAREWSTVDDISISPPSFKPVSLSFVTYLLLF